MNMKDKQFLQDFITRCIKITILYNIKSQYDINKSEKIIIRKI